MTYDVETINKLEIKLNDFLGNHFQKCGWPSSQISFFFFLGPETYGIALEDFSYELMLNEINELEVIKQFPNFQFVSIKLYLFSHPITFQTLVKTELHISYSKIDAALIKLTT